jgi:ferredoxin
MRVVVDLIPCQGYTECCFRARDVFRMLGEVALVYRPNPDDGYVAEVHRAASRARGDAA